MSCQKELANLLGRFGDAIQSRKMKNRFDVGSKIALVTVGSRGIGEMIALGFVNNSVKTYISFRKADACNATAEKLAWIGVCVWIPADMSSIKGVQNLADEFGKREEKLDILVNNAGATWGEPIKDFPVNG